MPRHRTESSSSTRKPIWTGTISFGLLNVPVQLMPGERSADLHFRMLDSRDRKPIRYERINAETGDEVPWKEVVKAFEYSKGNYVLLDDDEIRKAAPEATQTVQIEAFVDRADIDPRYFDKPYYLVPASKAEKGYVLLREILKKTSKLGISRVVIRTRQYLAALLPQDHALVLVLMRFPQEIVEAAEYAFPEGSLRKYRISSQELAMGEKLIDSMTTAWEPAAYKDDFRARLRKVIDAKIARQQGRKVKVAPQESAATPAATNVIDFTTLLKKSLAGRGKAA